MGFASDVMEEHVFVVSFSVEGVFTFTFLSISDTSSLLVSPTLLNMSGCGFLTMLLALHLGGERVSTSVLLALMPAALAGDEALFSIIDVWMVPSL